MARRNSLVSRVTKKYQATIPQDVRKVLEIAQGDCVAFEIESGQVILKKAPSLDWNYLNAVAETLGEWESVADEEAYSDL
ncbi:type II toxin-antitoxin system PrlF family antitoxin [Gloeocapsa sp. BRSZ]